VTAGGWSKMSDEPLAREREPIERMRARLEALVMANAAPRCGARSKRTGKPCRAAAMPNSRCKVHGGKSTGPRTPEGLERSRRANWKHGYYSREAKAERSRVRAAILALRYLRIMALLTRADSDVRFTPQSGQSADKLACPLSAKSGLMHRSKTASYSITSSARASSVGGISRRSAFAVLRLITNSNLIDCTTGSSAGFSPLRMRPV
jgi:hypothetical protein